MGEDDNESAFGVKDTGNESSFKVGKGGNEVVVDGDSARDDHLQEGDDSLNRTADEFVDVIESESDVEVSLDLTSFSDSGKDDGFF